MGLRATSISMPPEMMGWILASSANTSSAPVRARTMFSMASRRSVPGAIICRAATSCGSIIANRSPSRLVTAAPRCSMLDGLCHVGDRLEPQSRRHLSVRGVLLRVLGGDQDLRESPPHQLLDALLPGEYVAH